MVGDFSFMVFIPNLILMVGEEIEEEGYQLQTKITVTNYTNLTVY